MPDRAYNVLFLCTGNSARSIIAEAILNKVGAGKFKAYSAGSQPKGQVNPLTLQLLKSLGYDTAEYSSKSWTVFAQPAAPGLGFRFHGLRQRGRRSLPCVAGSTDDRALGCAGSGGSNRHRCRDRTRVQGSLPDVAPTHRDLYRTADPQPRPAQPATKVG